MDAENEDDQEQEQGDPQEAQLELLEGIEEGVQKIAKALANPPEAKAPVVHVAPAQIQLPAATTPPGYEVTFRRDAEGRLAGFSMRVSE